MASIYKPGESGVFYAQVLNGDGSPANAATVTLTVWRDDGSKFLDGVNMPHIPGSNGLYGYPFTAPATVGRMVADVSSTSPTAYGTEDVYVGQWTEDINSILAKTNLIGTSVALETGGNVAAIKAKTDLIPADITTQLDTNVPAVKAKTDLIPADVTTQLDTNIPAIKAKTDLLPADTATQLDTNIPAIKVKTDNLPSDPADESLLEIALTAIFNSVALRGLEATLTDMKGVGWTNETLKYIKELVDALQKATFTL